MKIKSPLTPPKGGEFLFFLLPPFKEGWGGFFIYSSLLREAGRNFKSPFKSPLTPPKGGELFVFSSPLGEVGRGFKYPFKTSPNPS